jgi:hypothetical protein
VWAILINYRNLLLDVWHLQCRVDKTCICLKPPGWRLPDILRADPRPNVDIANVRVADPATGLLAKPSACVRILLLTGASSAVVWQAGGLSFRFEVPLVAAICAGLWAIGRVLQGGMLSHWTLIVDAAVLPCFWRFV